MGSQANFVFDDMVTRYPGASSFYAGFKERAKDCPCGDPPTCARRQMQMNLEHLFDDDKEQVAEFFNRLHELGHEASEMEIRKCLADMGLLVSTSEERALVNRLEDLFGNGRVRVIGFPPRD